MVFKINIGTEKGKTYKLEAEAEGLIGKELNDKIQGDVLGPEYSGYEFILTGASDKSGFMVHENVEGIGLGKLLLSVGRGMHKKPKGDKKKNPRTHKGLRLRKTVRGKVISPAIIQINLKLVKEGNKKLADIFTSKEEPAEEKKE